MEMPSNNREAGVCADSGETVHTFLKTFAEAAELWGKSAALTDKKKSKS